jgi:hypothetical protein
MSNLTKNIVIVLGLATVGFAAYFVFMGQTDSVVSFESDEAMLETMLANSQIFIERRQSLEAVSLDVDLFTDERFTSLESYSRPIVEQRVGRTDPFEPTTID